jgi:SAM-dependent methyltransferase
MTTESKGSYTVGDYVDSQAEIDRLRYQAKAVFSMEKRFFDILNLDSKSKVLDAGCGPGFVAGEVYRAYQPQELYGIDLDPKLVEIGISENSGCKAMNFSQGSIYQLPFADDTFDAVYSRFVLQHLEKPALAIAEVYRVAKKGGTILIEDIDDGMLFLEPKPKGYDKLQSTAEAVQKSLGGDRLIGRKLYSLLHQVSGVKPNIAPMYVSSDIVGMEGFLNAAYGFKFDHLKRSGASEEEVSQIRDSFYSMIKESTAYGALNIFFASVTKQ